MKSITLLTVAIVFLWNSMICAGSRINNEQEEFGSVQAAILVYHKNTNQFPTSWDDLWNNSASRSTVEYLSKGKIFGGKTNMIEFFRFIAPGTTIILPTDGVRVLGMMTRPMHPPPDSKRRLLVVISTDGTRLARTIEESTLRKLFSMAGHDLADYTGPNGNWATESRFPANSTGITHPRPKKSLSDDETGDRTNLPPSNSRVPLTYQRLPSWSNVGLTEIFLVTLCLVFVLIYFLHSKYKSR